MAKQFSISLDEPDKWTAFLEDIPHTFAHSWQSCYAMQKTTGMHTYLYCFEEGNTKIACPIAERIFDNFIDITTPYGFSGFAGSDECPNFKKYWRQFVLEREYVCGYISLHPLFSKRSYYNDQEASSLNNLYFIDLRKSQEELIEQMDRNRKRQLRNWQAVNDDLITDKKILKQFLLGNYAAFMKSKKASQASFFEDETLKLLCDSSNVLMVGTGKANQVKSLFLFVYSSHSAECLINITHPRFRSYNTHLIWWGIRQLQSLGVPWLNLGGGVKKGDSIALSKERFGSKKIPYFALKQIYRPEIYQNLCYHTSVDHEKKKHYFPAFRESSRIY